MLHDLLAKLLPLSQHDTDINIDSDLNGDVHFMIWLFIHNDIYTSITLRTRLALDDVNTFHGMINAISGLAAQSLSQSPSQSIDEVLNLVGSLNAWQTLMEWLPTASACEQIATMVPAAEVHRCAAITAFRPCLGLNQDLGAVHTST